MYAQISVYDMMRNLFNYKKPFCKANLPIWGNSHFEPDPKLEPDTNNKIDAV